MSKNKRICLWVIIALIALPTLWFLGVEKSTYIEGCGDCIYQSYVTRYKVFSITVSENIEEHNTMIRSIVADLGVPCQHKNSYSEHTHKYIGLLIKQDKEFKDSEIVIGGDTWYNEETSEKVKKIAKENPEFAKQFYQRMIVEQDVNAWKDFFEQIEKLDPSE